MPRPSPRTAANYLGAVSGVAGNGVLPDRTLSLRRRQLSRRRPASMGRNDMRQAVRAAGTLLVAGAVVLRWNGSAWSRLAVPGVAGKSTTFTGVKAFSATDAWAVGASSTVSLGETLAMHFDGTAWARPPTPSPGTRNNTVTSVDGIAPGDVWAVGQSLDLPYGNRVRQSLIMHWNGSTWSQLPSPNNGSTYLSDVVAVSATDAWAVGSGAAGAFVTRWNGTAWATAPAPPLAGLRGVTARSGTDVWVAGSDAAGAPALAHWTGTGWSVTPVAVTGGVGTPALSAVTTADAATVWAVGSQWDGATGQSSSLAFRSTG
jgi:hypothetical protein